VDVQAIDDRFRIAQAIMRDAARCALGYSRDLAALVVESKGPQDLVSEADRATEALIRSAIGESFPGDGFVGEESGSDLSHDGIWVVDPIDGTQDFLLGLPTWCVSIAFVVGDHVEFGLVTNPITGDVYAARRGGGATWNGSLIHVNGAVSLSAGPTGVGYSPRSRPEDLAQIMVRLTSQGGVYRCIGSGALMVVWAATGQTIGYVEMHINAWDCLAAICIVEAAGGRTNDFLAEHGPAGGGRLVAAAPGVFDEVAQLLP
jgi:myo-inositol-1(or 4)-monophosphatase